jgi:ribosome-binding protein aMBF1 (putative translation factor)
VSKKPLPKGWSEGTVTEFLELTSAEETIIEMRVRISCAVREKRAELGISQRELAKRMGTQQPHVSDIENGVATLETMIRAYLALGGTAKKVGGMIGAAA